MSNEMQWKEMATILSSLCGLANGSGNPQLAAEGQRLLESLIEMKSKSLSIQEENIKLTAELQAERKKNEHEVEWRGNYVYLKRPGQEPLGPCCPQCFINDSKFCLLSGTTFVSKCSENHEITPGLRDRPVVPAISSTPFMKR